MSVTRCLGVSAACVLFTISSSAAAELSRYREFDLGSSLATVAAVTQSADRDVKTIHSRPALLQEVTWRPRYMTGPPVADRNSINDMVFSFVDDQLFRMSVSYDRSRTTGLTSADMIASLTEVYGVPTIPAARSKASADAFDELVVLAEWQRADAQVSLRRSYNESFSLIITSLPLEATARGARTTALALDAREAPAREAEAAQKRADDERQAEEKVRTTNKTVFRP